MAIPMRSSAFGFEPLSAGLHCTESSEWVPNFSMVASAI
jgi:hypothetical protein